MNSEKHFFLQLYQGIIGVQKKKTLDIINAHTGGVGYMYTLVLKSPQPSEKHVCDLRNLPSFALLLGFSFGAGGLVGKTRDIRSTAQ